MPGLFCVLGDDDMDIDIEKRIRRTDKECTALIATHLDKQDGLAHFHIFPETQASKAHHSKRQKASTFGRKKAQESDFSAALRNSAVVRSSQRVSMGDGSSTRTLFGDRSKSVPGNIGQRFWAAPKTTEKSIRSQSSRNVSESR